MDDRRVVVTSNLRDPERLPDWASEYAAITDGLLEGGVLSMLAKLLRIKRKNGYAPLDAFLFLVLFFTAQMKGGFKGLTEAISPWTERLGAVGNRCRMMTQQSLSRLLAKVEAHHIHEGFMSWILQDASNADEVLGDPNTVTFDSQGEPWNFFDFDGTLMVLRRRGLPEYSALPEPDRLVDDSYAVAGYTGRKRGEVQLCRETLQDSGSGVWLGVWCSPGDGDKDRSVREAAKVVARVQQARNALGQGVMRFDGGYGSWHTIEACAAEGVHYLIRWSQYGILNTQGVAAIRNRVEAWTRVEDSCSGPVRYAADIGCLTSPDDNHRTRLVCSRYRDEGGNGSGHTIDGWMYELYVTSVVAESWSADQVVTQYYGRVGQENRFAQEDNELALDTIFSTNIDAQALVTIVGLFVWNLRTAAGWRLHRDEIPTPPAQATRDIQLQPEAAEEETVPDNPLIDLLNNAVDWETALPSGWTWTSGRGLQCPASQPMFLKRVHNTTLVFRAPLGCCFGCSHRSECTKSTKARFRREIGVQAQIDVSNEVRSMKRRGVKSAASHEANAGPPRPSSARWAPPDGVYAGQFAVAGPFLVPSALRHAFVAAACQLEVSVSVVSSPREPAPRFIAVTHARRQRRRLTWDERNAWNALPSDAKIKISFAGWSSSDATDVMAATRRSMPQLLRNTG